MEELEKRYHRGYASGRVATLGALHNALYPRICEPDTEKVHAAVVRLVERLEAEVSSLASDRDAVKRRKDDLEKDLLVMGPERDALDALLSDVLAERAGEDRDEYYERARLRLDELRIRRGT